VLYMSYAIMRLEKRNSKNIVGMFRHNERKTENHSNVDINKELSHLNYQLIDCESYSEKINREIEERYKVNKSIRKDAVLCVEVLFTSDKEFFDKLTPEEERKYFEKSVEFLKEQFGEKNVVFATVHKDETTPHLHAGFIPMTDDGRLNYKNFVNGREGLIKLQNEYFKKMVEIFPELERGKNAEETRAKHITNQEYKIQQKETILKEKEKTVMVKIEELEKNSIELEEKKNKIKKLKEKLDVEEEKFYRIDDILNHVKESRNFLTNKVTVSMDKTLYKSLLKYAREGEKAIELEDMNKKLEKEKSADFIKMRNLEDRVMSLESKKISLELELQKYKVLGKTLEELGYGKALDECILYTTWKNGTLFEKSAIEKNISLKPEKELNKAEKKIVEGKSYSSSWEKKIADKKKDRGIEL
jgi:hypothetical protein